MKKYLLVTTLLIFSFSSFAKDYPASLFGIYSDGVTLNTRSIQFAIDYIHDQGGGRLVFDVGKFLTGTIHLKSNVTLHLKVGAVILGVLNPLDYDKDGFTSLIHARDQKDIAITGQGVIDGQGRQLAYNVAALVHKNLIKDLFRNDRPEAEIRAMLVYFRGCQNVVIKGVTMKNAAAWVQTYDQCRGVRIDSITVDSKAFWNNDGIDIVDCDSVAITNSYIDASDDGICLKSHDPAAICQNIIIRNCTIRSSANGIKFGTASLGGFRNVRISNIKVYNTYRSALAIEAVDGGIAENITADSLTVINSGNAIFLRVGERKTGKKGRMENIKILNLVAEIALTKPDAGYEYEGPIEDMPRNISPAVIITGLPGDLIANVTFTNLEIKHPGGGDPNFAKVALNALDSVPEKPAGYPDFSMFHELPSWGVYIRHAKGIEFNNLKLSCSKKDYRTSVVLDDVHQSTFINATTSGDSNKKMFFEHNSTGNIFR